MHRVASKVFALLRTEALWLVPHPARGRGLSFTQTASRQLRAPPLTLTSALTSLRKLAHWTHLCTPDTNTHIHGSGSSSSPTGPADTSRKSYGQGRLQPGPDRQGQSAPRTGMALPCRQLSERRTAHCTARTRLPNHGSSALVGQAQRRQRCMHGAGCCILPCPCLRLHPTRAQGIRCP